MLQKIISGGQTGADIAGVMAAKKVGLETGGTMPNGFITQAGPRPEYTELYNMVEHEYSYKYNVRTYRNVAQSDATVRFAYDFGSAGETCTLKAIRQCKKPHIDIKIQEDGEILKPSVKEFIGWLNKFDIKVLNVAGNSEKTFEGTTGVVIEYLLKVFKELGLNDE